MTLNEVMTQTADAIREKKGTSELIAPVNFAEEIKSISGGGGESGGSNYVYYKQIDYLSGILSHLWENSALVKASFGGETFICPPYYASELFKGVPEDIKFEDYIEEVCIDFGLKLKYPGEEGKFCTIGEMVGDDKDFLEQITKEQFYNLDA